MGERVDELGMVHACEQAPAPAHFGRATALSPPELLRLDLWASAFTPTFYGPLWLVGSVLSRRDFRDVDVRCVLDDDDPIFTDPDRLRLFNVAASVWAQQATGLNVDFQFQPLTESHSYDGKPRNPLGDRWVTLRTARQQEPDDD